MNRVYCSEKARLKRLAARYKYSYFAIVRLKKMDVILLDFILESGNVLVSFHVIIVAKDTKSYSDRALLKFAKCFISIHPLIQRIDKKNWDETHLREIIGVDFAKNRVYLEKLISNVFFCFFAISYETCI